MENRRPGSALRRAPIRSGRRDGGKRRRVRKWKARPAQRPTLWSARSIRRPGLRVRFFIHCAYCGALFCAARASFAQQEPARIDASDRQPVLRAVRRRAEEPAQRHRAAEPCAGASRLYGFAAGKDATCIRTLAAPTAETKRNYLIPIDAAKPGSESFWDDSKTYAMVCSRLRWQCYRLARPAHRPACRSGRTAPNRPRHRS